MQIVFNLPQLTSPDSSPAEVKALRGSLQACIDGIRRAYSQSNIPSQGVALTDVKGGVVAFNIPRTFKDDTAFNARVLRRLLDCLISCDIAYRQFHPQTPTLYQSGVVYGRTRIWETVPALYKRRYGDCKSLTAALVAEYRIQGIEANPVFRWVKRDDGGIDYHILVQTNRGFEDPSKVLGMGRDENVWFRR